MSAPSHATVFEKSSVFRGSVARLKEFHDRPTVFRQLTPPPVFVQLHEDTRRSNTEGYVKFTLWMGFIPQRWHVQHQPGPNVDSFADEMLSGPLRYWRHEHIVEAVEGGVRLTDRITYAHQPGWRGIFTRLAFSGPALRFLFIYRHIRTRMAVED